MNRQQQIDVFVSRAHVLAMQRLQAQPERVGEVRAQLERWRRQAGATRSDIYWDEWEALLKGPIETLSMAVCAQTDHGAQLRSVSPISVLITQSERTRLLGETRKKI
jgi:hypothetical protein